MERVGEIRFHGHILDVYEDLDNPLFLAVEVARMIDYSVGNTAHMLEILNDDEKILCPMSIPYNIKGNTRTNITSNRGNPNKWFVTEDGLYEILFQSRKPIAKRFKAAVKQTLRELRRERNMGVDGWFDELSGLTRDEWEQSLDDLREDLGR